MKKPSTGGDMPFTQQQRYVKPESDLGSGTAIPYWQDTLKEGECRKDAKPKDHVSEMNLQVPSTQTFTVRGREG